MSTILEREHLAPDHLERARLVVEEDERGWTLAAASALECARLRHAFRDYLEAYGQPTSDFDAAEAVFGELVCNCARHAPGPIRVEFRWDDATLVVIDSCDRLRMWPFSPDDTREECTHHAYAIMSALTGRVRVSRDENGGTRVSVVLPVVAAGG